MNSLAMVLDEQGKYEEREKLLRETLRLREMVLGKQHPDTAGTLCSLAIVLKLLGRYNQAEETYQQALELQKRVLGPQHPDTVATSNGLTSMLSMLAAKSRDSREDKLIDAQEQGIRDMS
jgi:tetratricopeptide (TPR) repeat protein